MTEKRPTITQRVAAGASLLDEREPEWFTRVNPALLDMADGCCCVLGQLYEPKRSTWRNGFLLGLRKLRLQNTKRRHGADAANGFNTYDDEWMDVYPKLENIWKREVRKRLKAHA